ncbi:MAG: DUF3857 domain-containing protein [Bacteroidetes bacterium]|nr:DUF3857 domain-containing protein [Bacteroidota bacterium]
MNLKRNKLVTVIVFLSIVLNTKSQVNNIVYDNMMWNDTAKAANITTYPDKWKDESAVILYQSEKYEFKKQVMNNAINEDSYFRARIILLDQTAVNEYSQFSTDKLVNNSRGRDADYVGIKVIKPNDEFHVVNQDDFIEMKQDGNRGSGSSSYEKVAIPNLAIGDIIDFYSVSIRSHTTNPNGLNHIEFDPVYKVLQSDYPILKGNISIIPERKTYLNAIWLNGAPKPTITKNKKTNNYTFSYGNLEKIKKDQMIFPLREYPAIIYQIIIAPKSLENHELSFLGSYREIKNEILDEEIDDFLDKVRNYERLDFHSSNMVKSVYRDLVDMNISQNTKSGIPEKVYYLMRHYLNFKTQLYYGYTISMEHFIDEFDFITSYSKVLDHYNIDHQIGVCVPRSLGARNSLVIHDQLVPFVKMGNEQPLYITKPEIHSIYGIINPYIEGVEATLIDPSSSRRELITTNEVIPISDIDKNIHLDSVFIKVVQISPLSISVIEKSFMKGTTKYHEQDLISTYNDTYLDETGYLLELNLIGKKEMKTVVENKKYLAQRMDDYCSDRHDIVELILTQSQAVEKVNIDTIELVNIGRWNSTDTLKFNYSYKINEGINKAGDNYLLSIGKFIGKNKEFTKEEINRTSNIYIDAPHKIRWTLVFTVPVGYTVADFDNLNVSVINSTGSFVSDARFENDNLIIDITKIYNSNYYTMENWPLILEFLDAAVDFTQQQILLIPEN